MNSIHSSTSCCRTSTAAFPLEGTIKNKTAKVFVIIASIGLAWWYVMRGREKTITSQIDVAQKGLEKDFSHYFSHYFSKLGEINQTSYFDEYDLVVTSDTWYSPPVMQQCLAQTGSSSGLLISEKTKSLFTLLLGNEKKISGLVVIDPNPNVKAYIDFVLMALRITKTPEEFRNISEMPYKTESMGLQKQLLQERINLIQGKITKSTIPTITQSYYLTNLSQITTVYFSTPKNWKNAPKFSAVHYHKDEKLFNKLKKYAEEGNIIAISGDIKSSKLEFLENQKITVIDMVSNQALLDIKLKKDGKCGVYVIQRQLLQEIEIMRTNAAQKLMFTSRVFFYQPLSEGERGELESRINELKKNKILGNERIDITNMHSFCEPKGYGAPFIAGYNKATLDFIRKIRENCLLVDGKLFHLLKPFVSKIVLYLLQTKTLDEITEMTKNGARERFCRHSISLHRCLTAEQYFLCSDFTEWKTAFKTYLDFLQKDPDFASKMQHPRYHELLTEIADISPIKDGDLCSLDRNTTAMHVGQLQTEIDRGPSLDWN